MITIVAPSAPGGLYSVFARYIASKFEDYFKTTAIVENRPGAGSIVGATWVARSKPDGHTLLVASTATLSVNPTLYKSISYDAASDFIPIAFIARAPEVLIVNAASPFRTVADVIDAAKKKPSTLTFGSAGVGSAQHLEGLMLQRSAQIEMVHVPYRGALAALGDVVAGHVNMMFTPVLNALPLIQDGQVRVLGAATADAIEPLPNMKPLADLGVAGFKADSWFMLMAPAHTPAPVIEKLRSATDSFATDPALSATLRAQGLVLMPGLSEEKLRAFLADENAAWKRLLVETGLAGTE